MTVAGIILLLLPVEAKVTEPIADIHLIEKIIRYQNLMRKKRTKNLELSDFK